MNKEILTVLKSIGIVVAGVLIANQIEKRIFSIKIEVPKTA